MASIANIVSKEQQNVQSIFLYQEGIFYKCYERSAYAFVTCVAPFFVKKRTVKLLKQAVVSVGFPMASVEKHFREEQLMKMDDGGWEVHLERSINLEDFEIWKSSLPFTDLVPSVPLCLEDEHLKREDGKVIEYKLRNYCLESKTPLECMLFLAELKKMLD